jgi:hypothetical protein
MYKKMDDSSRCTSFGTNAFVNGYCCVAIGDNTRATGAFQVALSRIVTIPAYFTNGNAAASVDNLREQKSYYQRLDNISFIDKATEAIDFVINLLTKKFKLESESSN